MNRIAATVLALGGWAMASSGLATSSETDTPFLKKSMSLKQANAQLLKQGWTPSPTFASDSAEMWGLQKKLFNRGIKAVEYCAVDIPQCAFKYRKNGACLRTFSIGENVDHLLLLDWTQECSAED